MSTEPSQPKELSVNEDKITTTAITLSWKKPSPSDVPVWYEVQYRKSGEDFESLTCDDLTCEVTGLAANTKYEFRVAAVNSAGHGPFTDAVIQFTSKSCIQIYNT